MRAIVLALVMAVAGCASSIMQSYVGKDITEAAMDYGPPAGVMDLPDGRRAFMWRMTQGTVMPQTTNYSAVQSGNWVTGTATTYGGGVSTWQCTYTLIGQRNPKGSYTVVDFRKPSLSCE
ncbi:hypothetical protein [Paracoccus versutus]|uniref:Uncharacterized protein n=1 Tax=Paracoccus versutus TaxID=34007 RepID=A0A3D9XTD6_PARVE|nr:hypothetical protein [Paracoccus versutus]REF72393.1 hypothetical protein BDD41_0863 [Paracoccus versutus]WGR55634.1 hypothetical protein E3U25_06540 [Paracoccus versutus]